MQDEVKTKDQLPTEVKALRQPIAESDVTPGGNDAERLLHELQVHQIELEMKNQELRDALAQLERSRMKYSDLYDFAPVGYLAFDKNGLVLEANLTMARQLGIERSQLVGRPFTVRIVKADTGPFFSHLRNVSQTQTHQACDVRLIKAGGDHFHALLDTVSIEHAGGVELFRTSVTDITERRKAEEELKQTNAYLENVLENSPDAIGIVDQHGKFIKWNKMAAELYGYSFEELRGKSSFDIYPDREEMETMLRDLRRQGSVKKREVLRKRKDGSVATFEVSIGLLQDGEGRVIGSVSVGRDLSEIKNALIELKASNEMLSREINVRKRAEEEVQSLSRQKQLILDAAGEGIVGLDLEGKVTFINPAGAELAGYQTEELIQKDFHHVVHHSRADGAPYPVHECPMFESLSTGVARRETDEVFWRKNGTNFPVAYSSTPILEESQILGAVVTYRDITLRKRMLQENAHYRSRLEELVLERTAELAMANEQLTREIEERKRIEAELHRVKDELELRVKERTAALEKANEELRQIPSKLIATQEEERRRLSSELHDSIGQTLAAVKFWIEMTLERWNASDSNAALDRLEQFVPILQRSIEETRNIYMGLRPTMLDNAGLLATLEWQRQECMKLYPQRHIELESEISEEEVPESLKVNIFRIAQEALNNIAKHSKAEWVDISLSKEGSGIELVVSDDGVGMDLDIILRPSTAKSFGLTSMRERAELTGGSFSIESTPGEGTTIRASWPIEADDQVGQGEITQ
ncbi:MAG: PAS domain S-box protein [Syntrophobacteraceae bacterium]|jgi:PAS domain S-box-containing protein